MNGALDAALAALEGLSAAGRGHAPGTAAEPLPMRNKAVALATVAQTLDRHLPVRIFHQQLNLVGHLG